MAERVLLPDWRQPAHYGAAAAAGVTIAQATIATAWNAQGPAARGTFADAAQALFGVALPTITNTIASSDGLSVLWLGPESWLLVAGGVSSLVDFAARRNALIAAGGALFDVSAARIAWTLSGPHAATVLAKGCPLDLDARVFEPGHCAQSVYGHVGVLLVGHDAATFTLMVARSYARDVWRALLQAAAPYGAALRLPAPYG